MAANSFYVARAHRAENVQYKHQHKSNQTTAYTCQRSVDTAEKAFIRMPATNVASTNAFGIRR